jgi:hypothetical protein
MFTHAAAAGQVAFWNWLFCISLLLGYVFVLLYKAILNCEAAPFPLQ